VGNFFYTHPFGLIKIQLNSKKAPEFWSFFDLSKQETQLKKNIDMIPFNI
jgi:hypothetical protein